MVKGKFEIKMIWFFYVRYPFSFTLCPYFNNADTDLLVLML